MYKFVKQLSINIFVVIYGNLTKSYFLLLQPGNFINCHIVTNEKNILN